MPKPRKPGSDSLSGLPRLPGLVLEGGKRPLGVSLPTGKEIVYPQVALWVDTGQEFVRTMAFIAPDTSHDNGLTETLEALKRAFTGPFMPAPPDVRVQPGLPEKVRIDAAELAAAARLLLEPLGVKVEMVAELPVFEELFQIVSEGIGTEIDAAPPEPYIWEIDRNLISALYRAAGAYAKLAPWEYMPDNPPVAIRLGPSKVQPQGRTLYASILGGAGIVQGVAFYDSLADLYELMEMGYQRAEKTGEFEAEVDLAQELDILRQMGAPVDDMSRQEALDLLADLREVEQGAGFLPELKDCLTFWLEERNELDSTYLEWLAERGLKYTKRQPVPVFNRVLTGGVTRPPDTGETEALRLAIEGMVQFFQKHGKQLRTGLVPVEGLHLNARTAEGAVIELKYPAPRYDEEHFAELACQEAASGKAFNIYQLVFDHTTGDYLEEQAQSYREQLLALFSQSPEGQTLKGQEEEDMGWAGTMLELGINYLGVTPAQMAPAQFRELLFDVFPRKVSVPATEAPHLVRELRLFWQFIEREFGLPNAAGNLNVLNEQSVERLQEELDNPANFGFAKSILMEGLERGFDLSSQAGMEEWMNTYNAEIVGQAGLPGGPGPLSGPQNRKPNRPKTRPKKKR